MTTTLPYAPIPAEQRTVLEQLDAGNQLSGVPPQVISWISQAESGPSYQGGAVNSAGYGGFFGLSDGGKYPAGTATDALLRDPSLGSYQIQAIITASAFAKYLKGTGGDYVAAENTFQTGSPSNSANGAGIFAGYLKGYSGPLPGGSNGGANPLVAGFEAGAGAAGAAAGAEAKATGQGAVDVFNVARNAASDVAAIGQLVGDLTSGSFWKRVGMGVLGAALVVFGSVLFLSSTKTGQRAISEGEAVAPLAAAA